MTTTTNSRPMRGSMPAHFPGTPDQIRANQDTHNFWETFDGDSIRCANCDCRMLSVSSEWPCGVHVPRIHFGPDAGSETDKAIAILQSIMGLGWHGTAIASRIGVEALTTPPKTA